MNESCVQTLRLSQYPYWCSTDWGNTVNPEIVAAREGCSLMAVYHAYTFLDLWHDIRDDESSDKEWYK